MRRLLLYSHDSFGLGHLHRSINVASSLLSQRDDCSVLCLTGSPIPAIFEIPKGFDYVKLPSVTKDAAGEYQPLCLPMSLADMREVRSRIITEVIHRYRPHVFLVDHSPLGMGGELEPALISLREHLPETRVLLGMRDIIDAPELVRPAWERAGMLSKLERFFDEILVYGSRAFFDPAKEYGLPETVSDRLQFVGHVTAPQVHRTASEVRQALGVGDRKLIVVTTGGGADGAHVLQLGTRAIADQPDLLGVVITGPLLEEDHVPAELASPNPSLKVLSSTRFLPDYLNAADLVVSMGGYNTTAEVLSLSRRSIIIPRVHPRLEQWERARRLDQLGAARCLHPDDLDATSLRQAIRESLASPPPPRPAEIQLDGVERIAGILASRLDDAKAALLQSVTSRGADT